MSAGCTGRMAHRKWKEIKQQPSMLPAPAVPGSCLVSIYFRWAIHPIRPVHARGYVVLFYVYGLHVRNPPLLMPQVFWQRMHHMNTNIP